MAQLKNILDAVVTWLLNSHVTHLILNVDSDQSVVPLIALSQLTAALRSVLTVRRKACFPPTLCQFCL